MTPTRTFTLSASLKDPAAEARRLLLLERSGEPDRHPRHIVSAARAVLRADQHRPDAGPFTNPAKPD